MGFGSQAAEMADKITVLLERQADYDGAMKTIHDLKSQLQSSQRECAIKSQRLHAVEEEAIMLEELAKSVPAISLAIAVNRALYP